MNGKYKTNSKGFTIIEVVLVLAIAGLIFLMVFIALPALQRSQRDTTRKNNVGTVAAAVNSYTSNNRGQFPSTATLANYVKEVTDNGTTVTVQAGARTVTPDEDTINVVTGAKCDQPSGSGYNVVAGTSRQYTVVTKLESGNGVFFCQDS